VVGLILLQTAAAPLYVPIIFGHKWIEAIPVLCIICLSALARPFAALCSQLLKAIGAPQIEFRWQIMNTVAIVIAVLIGSSISIVAVATAVFIVQTIILGLFAYLVPRNVFSDLTGKKN
jgi:teichuronic acid exporter